MATLKISPALEQQNSELAFFYLQGCRWSRESRICLLKFLKEISDGIGSFKNTWGWRIELYHFPQLTERIVKLYFSSTILLFSSSAWNSTIKDACLPLASLYLSITSLSIRKLWCFLFFSVFFISPLVNTQMGSNLILQVQLLEITCPQRHTHKTKNNWCFPNTGGCSKEARECHNQGLFLSVVQKELQVITEAKQRKGLKFRKEFVNF